jgi:DNA-3-methyladenine glycosylase II
MKVYLHEIEQIASGMKYLQSSDSVFSRLPAYEGHLWPKFEPGFQGLVRVVLGQQVSIKAASAVWERLIQVAEALEPETIISMDDNVLRCTGLSRQKISYIKGLALAVKEKYLDIDELNEAEDDEIIRDIITLKGFGLWSAQMYLMFALARPDVWPAGDLGVQTGMQAYLGLEERPEPEKTESYREMFSPHCTAASLLLWHMNSHQKKKKNP